MSLRWNVRQISGLLVDFHFLSAVNSFWQQLTADDSCHKKKFEWNFHLPPKADTSAKFLAL